MQTAMRQLLATTYTTIWSKQKDGDGSYANGLDVVEALEAQSPSLTNPAGVRGAAIDKLIGTFETRGLTGGTINRKMSALRRMLKLAYRYDMIDRIPIIPKQRESQPRTRALTKWEFMRIRSLLKSFGKTQHHGRLLHRMATVLFYTGMRLSELPKAIRRFKPGTGAVVLIEDTKNGTSREVPLCKEAVLAYNYLIPNGFSDWNRSPVWQPTTRQFREAWAGAVKAAGKRGLVERPEEIKTHTLRHSCATRLAQAGVPMPTLRDWMGHKSLATTMNYIHMASIDLRNAAKRLENYAEPHAVVPPKTVTLTASA